MEERLLCMWAFVLESPKKTGAVYEASKTGWLYDLSREIWKGYTATRFLYFCAAAWTYVYMHMYLFIDAGIYF